MKWLLSRYDTIHMCEFPVMIVMKILSTTMNVDNFTPSLLLMITWSEKEIDHVRGCLETSEMAEVGEDLE